MSLAAVGFFALSGNEGSAAGAGEYTAPTAAAKAKMEKTSWWERNVGGSGVEESGKNPCIKYSAILTDYNKKNRSPSSIERFNTKYAPLKKECIGNMPLMQQTFVDYANFCNQPGIRVMMNFLAKLLPVKFKSNGTDIDVVKHMEDCNATASGGFKIEKSTTFQNFEATNRYDTAAQRRLQAEAEADARQAAADRAAADRAAADAAARKAAAYGVAPATAQQRAAAEADARQAAYVAPGAPTAQQKAPPARPPVF